MASHLWPLINVTGCGFRVLGDRESDVLGGLECGRRRRPKAMVRYWRVLRAKHLGLYSSGLAPQRTAEKKNAEIPRTKQVARSPKKVSNSSRRLRDTEDADGMFSEFSAEKLFADGLAKQLAGEGPAPPAPGFTFTKDLPPGISLSGSTLLRDSTPSGNLLNSSTGSSSKPTVPGGSARSSSSDSGRGSCTSEDWSSFRELGNSLLDTYSLVAEKPAEQVRGGKAAGKPRRSKKVAPEASLESSADNLVKDLAAQSLASIVADSSVKPVKDKPLSLVARNVLMRLNAVRKGGDSDSLSAWTGMVRENDAIQVLENLDDGRRATWFFHWAEKQYNFKQTVFTYNAYLNTLVKTEDPGRAASVFKDMAKAEVFPDKYTYGIVIRGLCLTGRMHEAMALARDMEVNRIGPSSLVANFLIAGLCRAGMVNEAFTYFANLDERCSADVISYNLLIHGLCKTNQVDRAVGLFGTMQGRNMKPSMVTYNSVLYGLCKAGRLKHAMAFVNEMLDGTRGKDIAPDVFTYNTIIDGLCKANELNKARFVLKKMMKLGCPASVVTYNILVDGLCRAGKVDEADEIFKHMIEKQVQPTVVTYTTIIHGHCKLQEIDKANDYFRDMVNKNCQANVYTYTALIRGHCDANRVNEAMNLLKQMISAGVEPNVITYTTVISGLCRSGEPDKACLVFKDMLRRKQVEPDVFAFTTLVHGLCRHNRFQDAYIWFKKMVGIYQLVPERAMFRTLAHGLEMIGDREKLEDVCKVAEAKGITVPRLDPDEGGKPVPKYVRRGRPIPDVPNTLEQLRQSGLH